MWPSSLDNHANLTFLGQCPLKRIGNTFGGGSASERAEDPVSDKRKPFVVNCTTNNTKKQKNETNEKWVARGQKATPNVNCQGARPLSLATCCVDTKTAVTVAQPIHGFPD